MKRRPTDEDGRPRFAEPGRPPPKRKGSAFPNEVVFGDRRTFFVPTLIAEGPVAGPPARLDDELETADRLSRAQDRVRSARAQIFAQWKRSSDARAHGVGASEAWPSTLFGASAKQVFRSGQKVLEPSALPCIDRAVRREVLFAKRKAGRGYRKPKRRSKWAFLIC